MNISQLQPASKLAQRFGVKSLVYGGPGCGKTPMVQTAPRPVMCVVEPGMLSMRNVKDVPVWNAACQDPSDTSKVDEFFQWLFKSNEASQFDTICIDSVSQMAEMYLSKELKRNKDGRKAYGELSRTVMAICNQLYYLPNKHIYLIAKQAEFNDNNIITKRPYFPGQDLNIKVPHLFDEVFHMSPQSMQGYREPVPTLRTKAAYGVSARDRSGNLAELELTNLGDVFNKCMS